MSADSEKERERLKEEYKEHYRKIRDAREKVRRSRYVNSVNQAMKQMNADELLASVDEFLGKVRSKVAGFEARLDGALDQMMSEGADETELDEELKREKAKDTLKQIKLEMGLLYSELEKHAGELNVEKTVGKSVKPSGEKDTGDHDE
jgi:hypothetical protein